MALKTHGRQYDIVVFGATGQILSLCPSQVTFLTLILGYTGVLTAEHITTYLPTDLKWAVAGRSADKLRQLVSKCKSLEPDRIPPGRTCTRPHQVLD